MSYEARLIEYGFAWANIGESSKLRILDVGCCGSKFPLELAKRGHQVYGIDVAVYPDQDSFTFVQGDIRQMPFPDEFFDMVTAISTVEHVGLGRYGDPLASDGDKESMEEMARVLRSDGWLLMTVPSGKDTISYSTGGVPLSRVYSSAALLKLLGWFRILELSYIAKKGPVWLPASVSEAERLVERAKPQRTGTTAIALVAACKIEI